MEEVRRKSDGCGCWGRGIRIFDFFTDVINARPINQLTFCVIFLLKRSKLGRKKISYLHSFESN